MLTIQVVREEITALMVEIREEKEPQRVRALGDLLEQLNARYERLEQELLAEDVVEQSSPFDGIAEVG